jgi:hypothetical protein
LLFPIYIESIKHPKDQKEQNGIIVCPTPPYAYLIITIADSRCVHSHSCLGVCVKVHISDQSTLMSAVPDKIAEELQSHLAFGTRF